MKLSIDENMLENFFYHESVKSLGLIEEPPVGNLNIYIESAEITDFMRKSNEEVILKIKLGMLDEKNDKKFIHYININAYLESAFNSRGMVKAKEDIKKANIMLKNLKAFHYGDIYSKGIVHIIVKENLDTKEQDDDKITVNVLNKQVKPNENIVAAKSYGLPVAVFKRIKAQNESITSSKSTIRHTRFNILTDKFLNIVTNFETIQPYLQNKKRLDNVPFFKIVNSDSLNDVDVYVTPFVMYAFVVFGDKVLCTEIYNLNIDSHSTGVKNLSNFKHSNKDVLMLILKNMTQNKKYLYK